MCTLHGNDRLGYIFVKRVYSIEYWLNKEKTYARTLLNVNCIVIEHCCD